MEQSGAGVSIAGYHDLVRVGAGGFSTVYRAHQDRFDRTVAVKVLSVEMVDETAQRRFQRECRASGRLSNHPNIVTVLDSGFTDDGRPYIVTEYMSNGSLGDRLHAEGVFPVEEVLAIGVKMCSALAAVHAAGILHRDIKPQNILVSDYGEPALADFGISAITVGPEATTGTSSLTPFHTAPEVLEGQPTSIATDVYSLGSTLYTLLAARAPFQRGEDEALLPMMRRIVSDPVPDIDRPDVPPVVMELLRYTLAKQPEGRYPDAIALGEALQATQAHLGFAVTPLTRPGRTTAGAGSDAFGQPITGQPITGQPVTGQPVTGEPAVATSGGPPRRRSMGLVIGAAAVVVVVALVAAALVLRRGSTDTAASGRADKPAGASDASGGAGGGAASGTDAGGSGVTGPSGTGLRFDVDSNALDTSTPRQGGTLRVAIDQDAAGWNPALTRFGGGAELVAESIFDPLAVLADDGAQPYLASAITPNSSFDEWTIRLPAGVKFQDGTPLDANAVKANFDARLANEFFAPVLAPVKSVRVDGTATVVVSLRQPWPVFPVALAGQSGLIASPATLLDQNGVKPVGTGPFKFDSWEQGATLVVQRNGDYRLPNRPYLDTIRFSVVPETNDRRKAFDTGDVDVMYTTDPSAVHDLSSDYSELVVKSANVATIVFNTKSSPFNDVRLRQALSAAIDRQAINDQVFGGAGASAEGPFPPASPWSNTDVRSQGYDPDRARQLVAASGTPPKVTLLTGSSPRQNAVAQMVQSQWAAIGVDTEIKVPPDADIASALVNGDFQAALWGYDVPTDPDQWFVWFHSDAGTGFSYDFTKLQDPNVDGAFDKGRQRDDHQARHDAYSTLEQQLIDTAPAVWMLFLPTALVSSTKIAGWNTSTIGGLGRGGTPWATDLGFKA